MGFAKQLIITSIIGITATLSVIAQNTEDQIKTMLTQRDEQIKELLGPKGEERSDEQLANLKEIINGVIDFEAMAKTALDDTYNEISEESRTEFVDLFSTIVRDHSLTNLEIYRASITYGDVDIENENALVKTMAELEDVRTPVDYKMVMVNNDWVITDMSVDDLWTAESYKNQFQRIIARRGFDVLMDSLRKRAARD